MAEKELKKLNRRKLLEILFEQEKEIDRLRLQLAETKAALEDRTVRTENAGSLAEAIFSINNVYSDAENAAKQYMDNIRQRDAESEELLEKANEEAKNIVDSAEKIRQNSLDRIDAYIERLSLALERFYENHPEVKRPDPSDSEDQQ